jgi:hypothetical protein
VPFIGGWCFIGGWSGRDTSVPPSRRPADSLARRCVSRVLAGRANARTAEPLWEQIELSRFGWSSLPPRSISAKPETLSLAVPSSISAVNVAVINYLMSLKIVTRDEALA